MKYPNAKARTPADEIDLVNKRYYHILRGDVSVLDLYGVAKSDDRGDDADPPPPDVKSSGVPAKHQPITFDTVDGQTITARDERALARWLAIQDRLRKSNSLEDTDTMNASEHLRDLAKRVGPIAIAKVMVSEDRSYGITESELTDMIVAYAKTQNPELSDAMAFAKVFTDSSEAAVLLRRAVQVTKNSAYEDAVDDSEAACAELAKIGAERWGSLTKAQQFARAAETNPALLAKAHRRPSIFSAFPHPTAKAFPRTNVDVTVKPVYTTETDPVSPEAALAQLRVIGRQRWPSESEAKQFLNAVTDPENAALVTAALRPTGSSPPRQR